jgi:hypothetical protein
MKTLLFGLALAVTLTACHGHDDQATGESGPSAAEVEAGTTKDSADPRLNALQRTKRTINGIEADRKKADDAVNGDN